MTYDPKERNTRQLVDDMWDSLPYAWLGISASITVPLLATALGAFDTHGFRLVIAIAAVGAVVVGGVIASIPWFLSHGELRRRNDERDRRNDPR